MAVPTDTLLLAARAAAAYDRLDSGDAASIAAFVAALESLRTADAQLNHDSAPTDAVLVQAHRFLRGDGSPGELEGAYLALRAELGSRLQQDAASAQSASDHVRSTSLPADGGDTGEPLDALFTQLKYLFADLSAETGSSIELTTEGETVVAAREMVDRVRTPLAGLLRRAANQAVRTAGNDTARPLSVSVVASALDGAAVLEVSGDGVTSALRVDTLEQALTTFGGVLSVDDTPDHPAIRIHLPRTAQARYRSAAVSGTTAAGPCGAPVCTPSVGVASSDHPADNERSHRS